MRRKISLVKYFLACCNLVMQKNSEAEIETHFVWAVEMTGGRVDKIKFIGKRGCPDRVAFLPNGQMWFVELKAPKGRLSKLQQQFAADMERLQQRYINLWSKEQVDEWITGT